VAEINLFRRKVADEQPADTLMNSQNIRDTISLATHMFPQCDLIPASNALFLRRGQSIGNRCEKWIDAFSASAKKWTPQKTHPNLDVR
jgi:hypothetical protein